MIMNWTGMKVKEVILVYFYVDTGSNLGPEIRLTFPDCLQGQYLKT